ncbi:putative inactive carboxylesterase 4 [Antedon mediterranea]|uniref:putative inactive carboxylesterase 4 n=1 Tax=Antedon mediterranea TaxID=105859 RepID=UPI003AF77C4D
MAAVLVILALLLQPVCGYSEASGPYPTIQSKFGTVIGKSFIFDGGEHLPIIKTVNGYLSIPYAEPPVGPLRFMSPVAKSWTVKDGGNYNATVNRAACPQLKTQHFNFPEEITEDCLHLDVYTPNPTVLQFILLIIVK